MIPVNTPILNGKELEYVTECIKTGWISSEGPFVREFEDKFSDYVDRKYGIAVSNGSAALDIAVKALDIGKGDEVILPTFTIISPAQSIITSGAIPVLVDCNLDTWNIDVNAIEDKITSRTKAILVVHIYGLPVDMDPILAICKKYNLKLIEDAAEVHGQTYKGKKCGSFGDISIFSFYPNKHITTGEGGMIVCDNDEINERCKKLRNLAFEPQKRRFVHNEIGWNYRMTNIQAAIGLAQLENIEKHINIKIQNGKLYKSKLDNLTGFSQPIPKTDYADNIYWVYGLVAKDENLANKTIQKLLTMKIETRPFFWSMHEQPVFRKMGLFKNSNFPNSEKIARCGFYLPSGLGLTEEQINFISKIILE